MVCNACVLLSSCCIIHSVSRASVWSGERANSKKTKTTEHTDTQSQSLQTILMMILDIPTPLQLRLPCLQFRERAMNLINGAMNLLSYYCSRAPSGSLLRATCRPAGYKKRARTS